MTTPVGPIESWGTTWMVITGSSRGLGARISEDFASMMAPGSIILGLARSKKGLDETATKINQKNPKVQFIGITKDLSSCDSCEMEKILEDSLRLSNRKFERIMLIHNVGSLGKLDYLKTFDDFGYVHDYFGLNVSSLIPLTTVFLRLGRSLSPTPNIHIINISSLCAISPMKSWGIYCSTKAARDMLFKVLAAEEQGLHVLNYAPGPLDNEMQALARSTTSDPELKSMFQGLKDNNQLVSEKDSVAKLIQILNEGKYSSGDHVDYFD